jgi:NAD(P)H-hydrate epimerase
MKYVTAAQMKAIDKMAIEKYGVQATRLMENAGAAVVGEVVKRSKPCRALVVAGYGNNGGDGFVIARLLLKKLFSVIVLLAGRPRPFSNETGNNFKTLLDIGCSPRAVYDVAGAEHLFAELPRPGIIIDALFGIGIKGPLDAFYCALIKRINGIGAPVISVDVPSGLDADEGTPCPIAVKASVTVTFGFAKAGFRNTVSNTYTGEVIIADIGIPCAAAEDALNSTEKGA